MLTEITSALTLPGLPGWSGLVVLVVLILVALAYLLMPFSVFGVKGRLEAIEARLDEIQTEMRTLSLRLPDQGRARRGPVEDDWAEPPALVARRAEPPPEGRVAPPVLPPAVWPERGRSEPRVEWPRERR
jgi:hypothetical protein